MDSRPEPITIADIPPARPAGQMERKAGRALDELRRRDPGPMNTTHRRRTGRMTTWNAPAR